MNECIDIMQETLNAQKLEMESILPSQYEISISILYQESFSIYGG